MSSAPKGFEPLYTKVWPVREASITLERVSVPGARVESFRAVVADAATGDRIFSMERWGARTAILEASTQAARMGLKLVTGENRA